MLRAVANMVGGGFAGSFTTLTVSGQSSFAAGTAAAPSVKVGAEQNGLYSSAANTLDVTLGGVRQFQFASAASAVNYPQFTGSTTGNYIGFSATGTDINIGISYVAKGTGSHDFVVNSGTNFRVASSVASAVNFFTAYGQATGVGPLLLATGTDANVNARYRTQGTGAHIFETSGSGNIGFLVSHTASVVNYLEVTGAVTAGIPALIARGSDTNVSMLHLTKGTGAHFFSTGGGLQLLVSNTASAVNYATITGSATGNAVTISTGGSDTNRSMTLTAAGTGLVQIGNDSLRIVTSKTPASAAATGTQGQIAWDASYIYVCTANNTWKRAALATW